MVDILDALKNATTASYSKTSSGAPANSEYVAYAEQAAAKYQIPPSLLKSLIKVESDWNPNAIPLKKDGTPASSARGLGQVTEGALEDVRKKYGWYAQLDTPAGQVDAAAAYLRMKYDETKNWNDALAAYNQGLGNYKNAEGQAYAKKVMRGTDPLSNKTGSNVGGGQGVINIDLGFSEWFDRNSKNLALLILGLIIIIVAIMRTDAGKQIVVAAGEATS